MEVSVADVVETAAAETLSREETTTEGGTEDPRDKVEAEADLQLDARRDVAQEVTAAEDDHPSICYNSDEW